MGGSSENQDDFLPPVLARSDRSGEPVLATLLGGAVTAICAGLVPFEDGWSRWRGAPVEQNHYH